MNTGLGKIPRDYDFFWGGAVVLKLVLIMCHYCHYCQLLIARNKMID